MRATLCVLRSKGSGRRYVGITNDLPRRLREHASRHTQAGRVLGEFELVHAEVFSDHRGARVREKFLKSGQGRKWLDKLEARSWLAGGE
jgi:putative endonuclease